MNTLIKSNKAGLVKVAVQVNGRFGVYSSHRWKKPNAALDILKKELEKQGLKNVNGIEYIDKKTDKRKSEEDVLEDYQKQGNEQTLQDFVKTNYTIKADSKKKGNEGKQSKRRDNKDEDKKTVEKEKDIKIGDSGEDDNLPLYGENTLSNGAPVLDTEAIKQYKVEIIDPEEVKYTEEDNYIPGETIKNLKLPKSKRYLEPSVKEEASRIRQMIVDNLDWYIEETEKYYEKYFDTPRQFLHQIVSVLQQETDPYVYIKVMDNARDISGSRMDLIYNLINDFKYVFDESNKYTLDTSINFFHDQYVKEETEKLKETAETNRRLQEQNIDVIKSGYRPEELAGAKRNQPMTFEQADRGRINPNYGERKGFRTNCQSCVAVFEARLRGYDLETLPNENGTRCKELSTNIAKLWISPETGQNYENSDISFAAGNMTNMYKHLDETVKVGERYLFAFPWESEDSGHAVNIYKNKDGELVLYDPQVNQFTIGKKALKTYLKDVRYKMTIFGKKMPVRQRLLRIDDKIMDPKWLMGISKPSEEPTNNLEPETKLELSDDVYKNLDTLISPEGKSYVAELLKPLYNRGSGQNKPYKKYAAQHALDGSIQRLNIHMDNKPDSEKKFELKRDMQQLYDQLSMGVITLAQAMISPQFKNCAYLMLMALLEDDMEEEISNFMDVII